MDAFRSEMLDLCHEYGDSEEVEFFIEAAWLTNRYIREDDHAEAVERHLAAMISTRALQLRMANDKA